MATRPGVSEPACPAAAMKLVLKHVVAVVSPQGPEVTAGLVSIFERLYGP